MAMDALLTDVETKFKEDKRKELEGIKSEREAKHREKKRQREADEQEWRQVWWVPTLERLAHHSSPR